jgi:hypothetical protein
MKRIWKLVVWIAKAKILMLKFTWLMIKLKVKAILRILRIVKS